MQTTFTLPGWSPVRPGSLISVKASDLLKEFQRAIHLLIAAAVFLSSFWSPGLGDDLRSFVATKSVTALATGSISQPSKQFLNRTFNAYTPPEFTHPEPRIADQTATQDPAQLLSGFDQRIMGYHQYPVGIPLTFTSTYQTFFRYVEPEHQGRVVGVVMRGAQGGIGGAPAFRIGDTGSDISVIVETAVRAYLVHPDLWPTDIFNEYTDSERTNSPLYLREDYEHIEFSQFTGFLQYPLQETSGWDNGLVVRHRKLGGLGTINGVFWGYIYLKTEAMLLEESLQSGQCAPLECSLSTYTSKQIPNGSSGSSSGGVKVYVVDPVNVRSGGFDIAGPALALNTSAGPLTFEPTYASLATASGSGALGVGWTHNHDTRLILPDAPDGEAGFVWFKAHSANQFRFSIQPNGTYRPYAGVLATLVQNNTDPVTYTLTNARQDVYTFDETGRLLTLTDPRGLAFEYTYDESDRLAQVAADSGGRFLTFGYDLQDRIASVADQAGRQLLLTYDGDNDLIEITDVLGGEWDYSYDSEHRILQILDPVGDTVVINEYDSAGRVARQFDGEGTRVAEFIYGSASTEVIDAAGESTLFFFDERGTVTAVENSLGYTQESRFDYSFRPDVIADETGTLTQLLWSPDGENLRRVQDAQGNQINLGYDPLNNLTSVVDARGFLTTYEYAGTLLTASTDALNHTASYTYTPEGYLASVTDARGHTTSYSYDAFGQLISTTDALGHTTSFAYDSLGRLTDLTDALGRVTHNEYDAAGRLVRITRNYDPGRSQNGDEVWNSVTEYAYDVRGNQVSQTDSFGRVTQYVYDNANRLIQTIDPAGHVSSSAYDGIGNLVSSTDALGRTTTYAYDALNRLVAVTDPLGQTTATTYNPDGSVATSTDALGRTTTYTYDTLKRVIAVTNHLGQSTATTYDSAGNVVATTDARGHSTQYAYDALGRLIRQTAPDGGETEFFYDANGNRVQTIDARGHATTYAYDALNRLATITDAQGNVTSFSYDALGNRVAATDPRGNTTQFVYDELNRLVATVDALGHTSASEYDVLGRVTANTDPLGRTATYAYDVLDRLVNQTNPLGGVTSFTYDALGNALSVSDPRGSTRATVYDPLNRPVSQTDPLGQTSATVYDAVGNVTSVTDALGHTTTFSYDALGRQVAMTNPNGDSVSYSYDANGNRVSLTDGNGVVTRFEYDEMNRLTAVLENYLPAFGLDNQTNVRTEYSYDLNGNRLTISDGNGQVTSFSYDSLNRLTSETDALGHTWTFGYDASGNRVSLYDANLALTQYTYDALNRLVGINYPGSDPDVSIGYDAAGQRTAMTDGVGTTSWSYDALGRPTAINDPFGETVGYGYDAAGNRTALTYPDGKVVSYAYDAASRLTGVTDWDDQVTTYAYDAANRLAGASLPNGVISNYVYDPAGQLLSLTYGGPDENELSSFQYAYDAAGNRVQVVENVFTPGGDGSPFTRVQLLDTHGLPLAGITVYAYDGETYTDFSAVTDVDGVAEILLPFGDYRFRADVDGTQFWSGLENHCTVDACNLVAMTINPAVTVTVLDTLGAPQAGLAVYAFSGGVYTNYSATTDENGQATFRLLDGAYRFRVDRGGTQHWSSETDDCVLSGCETVDVALPLPVAVTVADAGGIPYPGVTVYAFSGGISTNVSAVTDADGVVSLDLPAGAYRFRADVNGRQLWSSAGDDCAVPGCAAANVVVEQVAVSVVDGAGAPRAGAPVYLYDASGYLGYSQTADANGQAVFTVAAGAYRFRADVNGVQLWSSAGADCAVPGCAAAQVLAPDVTVTVQDNHGQPLAGVKVYAYNGASYTGYTKTTDASGQAVFTLPTGSYRFRADVSGVQVFSEAANHCTLPECAAATVVASRVDVAVQDQHGNPLNGIKVYAFTTAGYTGYTKTSNASGDTTFTLPFGTYRFRADVLGTQIWSDTAPHCATPGCDAAAVVVNLVTVRVQDGTTPLAGTPVYLFNGPTYVGQSKTTNASGEVVFALNPGSYRFRADAGGVQYWSGTANHCDTPNCDLVILYAGTSPTPTPTVTVTPTATVSPTGPAATPTPTATATETPLAATNTPVPSDTPAASTATDTPAPTDTPEPPSATPTETATPEPTATTSGLADTGRALYRPVFAAAAQTSGVLVTVLDTDNNPLVGVAVYAYSGGAYANVSGVTDGSGQVSLTLLDGNYRFRADVDGTQFWSGASDDCAVPGCAAASVSVSKPTIVTVTDNHGQPLSGVSVYAFDGAAYTNFSATTDPSGQATFRLPFGSYRFRADVNGVQVWSGEANHCAVPGCEATGVTASFVAVSVTDGQGAPLAGEPVYAFDGTAYTNYSKTTDSNGVALFTLPAGSYRFRADVNGAQLWSGEANHCTTPACDAASVSAPFVTVTVADGQGAPLSGVSVYAFDGGVYTGHTKTTDAAGQATFTLPAGDYAFRADVDGVQLWSGPGDHCELPVCTAAGITAHFITVAVLDGAADPVADVPVYLFDGATYLSQTRTTDAAGQATFVVPAGSYRFRADLGGTQLWSGEANHCDVSVCTVVEILAPRVAVTVLDQGGVPLAGVAVYVFSGGVYQNQSAVTDEDGQVDFVLPAGSYRFRADVGGNQLWSSVGDDCLVPTCAAASITAHFVTVSVQDQAALPLANIPVYVFSGETYLSLSATTDETGQAIFALPEGEFRFRADVGGTQLWSSVADDCVTPGCTTVSVTAHFVTVMVESTGGTLHAGVPVYLFDGETYLDKSAVTDADGKVAFVLPEGAYRFRADLFEVPFWSAEMNECLVPGCTDVTVLVPGTEGVGGNVERTIDYVYDPLNRLTEANYDDETYFHYVYDPVGNRLSEETQIGSTSYAYDAANRLTNVAGQAYTWDANGNLLSDGTSSYTYDKANRLVSVTQNGTSYAFAYNGTGDRLRQTVDGVTTNYTLDLAAGLTQVLADGTSTYLYGLGRVGEQGDQWQYHLGDALGSVRQLAGADGAVSFAQSYAPYGSVLSSGGGGATAYGYTGEWTDGTGLMHLRARYLDAGVGRFTSRDVWGGEYTRPLSFNRWAYVEGNPVNLTDPSGHCPEDRSISGSEECWRTLEGLEIKYPFFDFRARLEPVSWNDLIYPESRESWAWTRDELLFLENEVDALASKMTSVTLAQVFKNSKIKIEKRNGPSHYCGFYYWPSKTISLYSNWTTSVCHHTVVHEIGHAWDGETFGMLSRKFSEFVGAGFVITEHTLPNCANNMPYGVTCNYNTWDYCVGPETPPSYGSTNPPNPGEDFAESLAEFVFSDSGRRINPTERRYQFIYDLLNGNP